MKTIKTLAIAAVAVVFAASCQKAAPVSDAVVSFAADAYEYAIEQGPNFEIPINVTGSNIVYPFTIKVSHVAETEENGYSERNVDYRFIEREIVVESAEVKPVVTVRIIKEELESLSMAVQIVEVSNGTINTAASKVALSAEFGLCKTAGVYTVAGTKTASGATVEYSEPWYFLNEGADFIGFWGLLGMYDLEEYWPIYGDAVYDPEDNTSLMTFFFGIDNYVTAANFNGIGPCYVVPVVKTPTGLTTANIQMLSDSKGNIQIGLPDGYGFTYALFAYPSEAYTGYTYGGTLIVNNNMITRTADAPAVSASASTASNMIRLQKEETGEFVDVAYEIIPTEKMR